MLYISRARSVADKQVRIASTKMYGIGPNKKAIQVRYRYLHSRVAKSMGAGDQRQSLLETGELAERRRNPSMAVAETTMRRYILFILSLESKRLIKEEAASVFVRLTGGLLADLQITNVIISKEVIAEAEESRLIVGLSCENASKHTFEKKIKDAFAEYTIFNNKIETKKGLGAWSFALLGEDKEQILSFGHNLSFFNGASDAFQQHRAVPPRGKKQQKRASARKTTNRTKTPLPEAHHLNLSVVRLVKRVYAFLFIFSPKLWNNKLKKLIAILWWCLVVSFILVFVIFLFNFLVEAFGITLEISPETAKKFNDILELVRMPRLFQEPPLPHQSFGITPARCIPFFESSCFKALVPLLSRSLNKVSTSFGSVFVESLAETARSPPRYVFVIWSFFFLSNLIMILT